VTHVSRLRGLAASVSLGLAATLLVTAPSAGPANASATARAEEPTAAPAARKHRGKVKWDSKAYVAGFGQVAAHGKLPFRGKRKVRLQVKLPGKWDTFGSAKTNKRGKFSISGRLDWYGEHKVRVFVAGRHRFKKTTKVQISASYAPRGNPADHVFTTGERGLRYSFDPCETIKYVVNADDVGPFGITLAQIGMAQLSYATGIKVKFIGTSHQIPFQTEETKLPANQDLLIAWADEAELPAFVTTPAIGFGGPSWVRPARDGRGRPILMTTQAAVVLDTNAYFSGVYTQGYYGTKPAWGEVILHELGHASGLAHVGATDEIMYPGAGNGPYPDGTFQGLYDAGDLAGLATNGLQQGCFHKVRNFREGAERTVAAPAPQP